VIEALQIVITIVVSVASAYLSVRIALARLDERIASIERELTQRGERLNRLEAPHFKHRG
jgi:cell division protein FtsL